VKILGKEVLGKRMEMEPFVVDVSQVGLDDLRERLARTRWPDEVAGAAWDYGASLAYVRELVRAFFRPFRSPRGL
jgi:Epoxide hydrolase N terminus